MLRLLRGAGEEPRQGTIFAPTLRAPAPCTANKKEATNTNTFQNAHFFAPRSGGRAETPRRFSAVRLCSSNSASSMRESISSFPHAGCVSSRAFSETLSVPQMLGPSYTDLQTKTKKEESPHATKTQDTTGKPSFMGLSVFRACSFYRGDASKESEKSQKTKKAPARRVEGQSRKLRRKSNTTT